MASILRQAELRANIEAVRGQLSDNDSSAEDRSMRQLQLSALGDEQSKHLEIELRIAVAALSELMAQEELLVSELSKLQRQSTGLQHAFQKALDTPLQSAIYTIQQLLHVFEDDSETCDELTSVLKDLMESHPYIPTFNFSSADLATDACQWISGSLQDAFASNNNQLSKQHTSATSMDTEVSRCHVARDLAMETALQSLGFDIWEVEHDNELEELVILQFARFHLPQIFHIPEKILRAFVTAVRLKYHASNPYHNFRHGLNVLQVVCALCTGTALQGLRALERLALLTSAICIDCDHGGVTDNFLVHTDSPLAQIYSGAHINENHHCAVLWKLLADPETNILGGVTSQQWRELRKTIIAIFMATPTKKHFDVVARLASMCGSDSSISFEAEGDRTDLLCAIVHAADMSAAVCRPKAIADKWSKLRMEEFWRQGDTERALGIAISPMCGRITDTARAYAATVTFHCNYGEHLLLPLIDTLDSALGKGEPTLAEARRYLKANIMEWQMWRTQEMDTLDTCTILGLSLPLMKSASNGQPVEVMSASPREQIVTSKESSNADITLQHGRSSAIVSPTLRVAQSACCRLAH